MNELIRITEQNGKKAVSARELYEFLGYNKAAWKRWYTNNIIENPYAEENIDWVGFNIMLNGNETQDFALSIKFAKKLSMMAKTEKGEQARDYFIACEGQVTSNQYSLPKLQDLTESKIIAAKFTMQSLSMNDASKILLLKAINEPLGLPVPDYVDSRGVLLSISQIVEGTGISAQKANKILSDRGVLVKRFRRTSKGKEKPFWVIADQYGDWGENKVHPQNQDEVQTKWYEHKKDDILKLVGNNKAA